jgi:ribosome-associated protein
MPDAQAPTPPDPGETLRLDDALKLAGVASTGGEAKVMIQGGAVRVNGAVETRRKRRLIEGDVVEVGDETFEIAIADVDDDDDVAGGAVGASGAHGASADDEGTDGTAAHEVDPYPIRAPGAGELEEDGGDDDEDEPWDDDDEDDDEGIELRSGFDDDDDDDDALRLDDEDLARWAAWVEERVGDDDVEAVIIRLGALHPDALEEVFARLPADVEERVLDGLDAVLEGAAEDGSGGPGDAPMQA